MDYVTLNAIAIAVFAAFGLWAFQYAGKKQKQSDEERKRRKNRERE